MNLSAPISFVLLAAVWASANPPDRATNSPATWELLPKAEADRSGIFLHQLVSVHPPGDLPPLRLAPAPAWGQTSTFTRAQLNDLLQQAAPELNCTNWNGAAHVSVTRRARQLAETELKDLLCATLQADYVKDQGELELRLTRRWEPILVPEEDLTLKIVDLPTSGVSAYFIVRFELWSGEERLGHWHVGAQASIWQDVLVAHSPLRAGQLLSSADVTCERQDLLNHRSALTRAALAQDRLELVSNVPKGTALMARSVRVRPLVRRGRLVDAVVLDGALSISMKAEALEDGLLDQMVRVRNPQSRREFYGKVHDEQTVVVSL